MNYERVHNKCVYTCDETHSLRNCPIYKKNKENTSDNMYIDIKLKEQDELGFCASGIFLFYSDSKNTYVLMLKEYRKKTGENGYNFPAGGRESKYFNSIYIAETSKETALSEFNEEIGVLINNIYIDIEKYTYILWNGRSKYVLYFLEINKDDSSIYKNNNLKWINLNNILSENINRFNIPIIKFILKFKSTLNL